MTVIHSLAGGEIRELQVADFAKVEIIEDGVHKGAKLWYISEIRTLKKGDLVLVPLGTNNQLVRAKVERIDKQVNSQVSPVPMKRAKKVKEVLS